ncbi:hypothetical protein [Streptomyces monashensis]|uniref:hypothetical protein n=1 Tax=Streptomyces monashensis TaxID=1678012 RepID=UPI0011609C4C|nr:hypothetical protein [Streptomyces monashensis]
MPISACVNGSVTDDRPEVSRYAGGGCSHVPTSRANTSIEQFRRTGRGYGDPERKSARNQSLASSDERS